MSEDINANDRGVSSQDNNARTEKCLNKDTRMFLYMIRGAAEVSEVFSESRTTEVLIQDEDV